MDDSTTPVDIVPMQVDATMEDASVISLTSPGTSQPVPLQRALTDPVHLHREGHKETLGTESLGTQVKETSAEANKDDANNSSSSNNSNNNNNNNNNNNDSPNVASLSSSYAAIAMSDFQPSVAMLRKHWEGYVIDGKGMQFDSLKRFFGGESEPPEDTMSEVKAFYTPLALRHTHSTPLKKTPSILDEYAMKTGLPPPIPLDPFQRSSSTPSAFRTRSVNSAFGTVRSELSTNTEEDCSLAGVQYVSMEGEPAVSYRCSAFDPVQYYARQLEDMAVQEDMERTTIEVTDASMAGTADAPKNPAKRRPKRGAAVAERFLANVRVFRRRRRGRSMSYRSPSSAHSLSMTDGEDDEDQSIASVPPPQTTVTVTTESEDVTRKLPTLEPSAILKQSSCPLSSTNELCAIMDEEEPLQPSAPTYHSLASDTEEDAHYQKIEASLQTESPASVPSPTYDHMEEDRVQGSSIRIQVSGKKTPPVTSFSSKENTSPLLFNTTPSPPGVSRSLESALTQRSNDSMTDSPQTNRSSNTGSSMGHTTQATSCSSIQQSNLSTISETDREVMLANKEGKRRRGLDSLQMSSHSKQGLITSTESVNSSSTNSNSTGTNPHGYLALQANPSFRDGANVAMDRFFTNGSGQMGTPQNRVHSLGNSSSSRKSGRSSSPGTDGSSALTHTSSSSSSPSEPPTFVSYLYKKNTSDLTTTREEMEESCDSRSGSCENEEREGSPAPIVAYQPMYFEGAALLSDQKVPKPVRPPSRTDKFRSRPPRSPLKGSRMMTTPPPCRTPPMYQQLSPPRHDLPQNISQPYLLRSTETGKSLVSADSLGPPGPSEDEGVEVMHGVTYEEHSIEVTKSSAKKELLPPM